MVSASTPSVSSALALIGRGLTELASALATTDRGPFTSLELPPGCTRRRFAERCAEIAEATKDGRVWVCPCDAWERVARRRASPVVAIEPENDSAASLLAKAGVRRVAGKR